MRDSEHSFVLLFPIAYISVHLLVQGQGRKDTGVHGISMECMHIITNRKIAGRQCGLVKDIIFFQKRVKGIRPCEMWYAYGVLLYARLHVQVKRRPRMHGVLFSYRMICYFPVTALHATHSAHWPGLLQ